MLRLRKTRPALAMTAATPRGTSLRRALTVCAVVAAATALTATTASADTRCAFFTTSQPDWAPGTNWGSWVNGTQPGPNAIYIAFQNDGNLVAYRARDNAVMWASGTYNDDVVSLDWSASSGGIKLMRSDGTDACTIRGNNGATGGWAQVQDDGNFVFYRPNGAADFSMWSTPAWPGGDWRNFCAVSGHN